MTIVCRVVEEPAALAAFPHLERIVWGADTEVVGVDVLVAVRLAGGVVLGAYDDAQLIGSALAFATSDPAVMHSHYVAVHPDHRSRGLGRLLKEQQRQWCLDRGVHHLVWTFDPLQLANAHLNLRVLGARGVRYLSNLYGPLGGINGALPSDRVEVHWALRGNDVRIEPGPTIEIPVVAPHDVAGGTADAVAARVALRDRISSAFDDGWLLVDVDRDARCYRLGRAAS
jgi:predicted GNAT superfamily acetyltransferase